MMNRTNRFSLFMMEKTLHRRRRESGPGPEPHDTGQPVMGISRFRIIDPARAGAWGTNSRPVGQDRGEALGGGEHGWGGGCHVGTATARTHGLRDAAHEPIAPVGGDRPGTVPVRESSRSYGSSSRSRMAADDT